MKNFMAFMNQTSAPVLIVMGSLLLLFLMIAFMPPWRNRAALMNKASGHGRHGARAIPTLKVKQTGAAYE